MCINEKDSFAKRNFLLVLKDSEHKNLNRKNNHGDNFTIAMEDCKNSPFSNQNFNERQYCDTLIS